MFAIGTAARQHSAAFALALLDVTADRLERLLVNYGAHVGCRIVRIAQLDFFRAFRNFVQHLVVDTCINDRARARGTFLSLKAECRLDNAGRRFIKVCILSNNDRVFSAHLRNHSFDPDLPVMNFRGALVDSQPNFF